MTEAGRNMAFLFLQTPPLSGEDPAAMEADRPFKRKLICFWI